jgi:hypothetical protein
MPESNGTQPDPAAGFCTQWGPEKLAEIDREWAEAEGPREPAPPIANVALALELAAGIDAEREFWFQGRAYLLKPTPYGIALRLIAWSQQLGRLEAMARLIAPAWWESRFHGPAVMPMPPELSTWEQLPELQDCYRELIDLAGQALASKETSNPFTEARIPEVHSLVAFLLDDGDEVPITSLRSESPAWSFGEAKRYDAAHYLYAYLEHFGTTPGMVVLERGRPVPASWRHYQRALAYLNRREAEQMLNQASVSMGSDEKTIALLKHAAGMR